MVILSWTATLAHPASLEAVQWAKALYEHLQDNLSRIGF